MQLRGVAIGWAIAVAARPRLTPRPVVNVQLFQFRPGAIAVKSRVSASRGPIRKTSSTRLTAGVPLSPMAASTSRRWQGTTASTAFPTPGTYTYFCDGTSTCAAKEVN